MTQKFIIFLLLVLVFSLGCAKEPVQDQLLRDMGQLDRLYVPLFVFTNLHKQRESELAFERFNKQWAGFYAKYHGLVLTYGENITDKYWPEDLETINKSIGSIESFVAQGWLTDANRQLRQIRLVFMDLRRRNSLDYYLDSLITFQDAMDEVLVFLRGKNRLSDRDLDQLREVFRIAQGSLIEAENVEFDFGPFGFDEEKKEAIRKRIREEQKLLAGLAAALSSANIDKIFQSSLELKPNFMVLYKAFGDFQPIFDQIIKEREGNKDEAGDEDGSK
ncbi:MAG: hypothetical protein ABH823_03605 [bacterium]